MNKRPILALTMGDPVGIGPEILARALSRPEVHDSCRPLVAGDLRILEAAAKLVGSDVRYESVASPARMPDERGAVACLDVSALDPAVCEPGLPTSETGDAMVRYILEAIDLAMAGEVDGVVTGPIHKAAMQAAGHMYAGHTEILAERTGAPKVVMMLAGDRLRVVLVTIHMALRDVPDSVTPDRIVSTMQITHDALRDRFGIPAPRLAVAGLNPHAGEDGLFGDEEARVVAPAMETARGLGMNLEGPFPPDTLFHHALGNRWDAVVCMYHDQGLIPFKMIHFEDGVNTTLGLPIIRTSVDHGTAYDLAGTGRASDSSLVAAIRMAAEQARNAGKAGF
ncbi:MAG: 4-hydroxythreonine-4-phosphate dehydrogenase PdxA [Desulfatibacillaceae bacterium]